MDCIKHESKPKRESKTVIQAVEIQSFVLEKARAKANRCGTTVEEILGIWAEIGSEA